MKKNIDYWDALLNNAPKSYKDYFLKEGEYLKKFVKTNAEVLEVGCGDGRSICDILSKTKNITGVDHETSAVLGAGERFAKEPSVRIIKADVIDLPFVNETFDFVVCLMAFVNFADKKYKALEEMKRVLKKDGKIIVSVFSENALEERLKIYKILGTKIENIHNGTVTFDSSLGDNISEQFSKREIEEIFSKVNLKISNVVDTGIAYLFTAEKSC